MLELASLRLQDYTGVIRRRYWIVIVLALVAVLAAYFYSSRQQPMYRAGVSVLVTPNVIDYWTMGAVERLLNTYVGRVRTGEVAQRVVDRKELDVSPDTVLGSLRTVVVQDSYIVVIQAESASPQQAVHAANGFAYEFVQLAQSEQSSGPGGDVFLRARILDEASNAAQIGPRVRFNVAVALVLGAIAGIVLALASEFLDARVRLRREAEQILGVPIVACIPPVPK
ncbi:MAG: hypothetical protein OXM03_06190 [Chloroflexota bacterium]|nr:hypothetical protein [Chloroflexota bacterium]MDE2840200.1 hypothetical protein [Chloroflexota bacterium]MDE2931566.1 hypothetical protein [Chloroflexota bacterium]